MRTPNRQIRFTLSILLAALMADPLFASAHGLLSVENESGKLSLYDLATMQKRDDFVFSSSVVMQHFSPDSRSLFVLTADQTAFMLDVSSLVSEAARN